MSHTNTHTSAEYAAQKCNTQRQRESERVKERKRANRILNCCLCFEHDKCLYVLHSIMSIMSTGEKHQTKLQ